MLIHRLHQFENRVLADFRGFVFQGGDGGAFHDRDVVTVKTVFGEEFAHFHFDQFDEVGVGQVHLVEEDDERRHADLAGE